MRILFVDDDAIIRRSMKTKIDWASHGWELVYEARDAMETLDFLKDNEVDIILSDIKLPGMNGIEMASIARDYYPLIKFVFLSGYKDFEYAQQVLKLNAVDYLTKPVDPDQLTEVLERAEKIYRSEQEREAIISQKYPQIKRSYISRLLRESFRNLDDSFLQAFDINISSGVGVVAFVDLKYNDELPLQAARTLLEQYCDILTRQYRGSFFFCMDDLRIFMIYTDKSASDEAAFQTCLSRLENQVNTYVRDNHLGSEARFIYGTLMHSMNDLYASYQVATRNSNLNVEDLLKDVHSYIDDHYSDCELSLGKIADHFNINHSYLTSIFKKKYGINLYDYIIHVRMENAAKLVTETDLKNYEIAEATGYSNPQYFSLSFKKYFHCTVTQYREQKMQS